jgi:Skp family chaperone for outer membrane proteins
LPFTIDEQSANRLLTVKEQYKKVMKTFRIFAAAVVLAALLAIAASAQTRPGTSTPARTAPATSASVPSGPLPETKIAFIDTGAFGAEQGGITRYVNAMKSLEREFQPRQTELENMQNRIKALADEINKLNSGSSVVDPKTIQAKQDEGERLQRDLKYKQESADAEFKKRYNDVVSPISTDIGNALDQFAQRQGITMILDISKLAPAILTLNKNMDVTQAFITEYNSTHPATASTGK